MPSTELKLVPKLFSAELKLATSVAETKAKKKLQSRMMCKRGAAGGVMDAEVERQRKRSACVASGSAQLAELFRLLDNFPGFTRSKVHCSGSRRSCVGDQTQVPECVKFGSSNPLFKSD